MNALQSIRIKHCWDAVDKENNQIKEAKKNDKIYQSQTFANGDTLKQLLVRSRYLLYKTKVDWIQKQQQRADILFEQYPDIELI